MRKANLNEFTRGWVTGAFEGAFYSTPDMEFAVQTFKKGTKEASHCHKIATEITVIVKGKARMQDQILNEGDVVEISPGEYTDFEALEDTITAVIKHPGALNDKYLDEESGEDKLKC